MAWNILIYLAIGRTCYWSFTLLCLLIPPVDLLTPPPTTTPIPAETNTYGITLGPSLGTVIFLLVMAIIAVVCVFFCMRRRKSKTILYDIELLSRVGHQSPATPRRPRGMTQIVKANMVISNSNLRLLDSIGEGNVYATLGLV